MKQIIFWGKAFSLIILMALYSCSNEVLLQSVSDYSISLTDEECFYMNAKSNNHVLSISQAFDAIPNNEIGCTISFEESGLQTEVLRKAHFGISENSSYDIMSDTLVYLVYDKNGYCNLVAADDRIEDKYLGCIKREILFPTSNFSTELDLSDYMKELCLNKMLADIQKYEERKDSMQKVISEKWIEFFRVNKIDKITRANYDPKQGYSGLDYDIEINDVYLSDWENEEHVDPLLNVSWHQKSPYNEYVKEKNCPELKISPAGCIPVAIGMLLSYWKYPQIIHNTIFDWNQIVQYPDLTTSKDQVALLMEYLGDDLDATYSCGGTSVKRQKAGSWLLSNGYMGGQHINYNKNAVISSLHNAMPVIIIGLNTYGEGHAWVIDGYDKKKRKVHRYYIYTNKITGESYTVDGGIMYEYSWLFSNNFGHGIKTNWLSAGYFYEYPYEPSDEYTYSKSLTILSSFRPINY